MKGYAGLLDEIESRGLTRAEAAEVVARCARWFVEGEPEAEEPGVVLAAIAAEPCQVAEQARETRLPVADACPVPVERVLRGRPVLTYCPPCRARLTLEAVALKARAKVVKK